MPGIPTKQDSPVKDDQPPLIAICAVAREASSCYNNFIALALQGADTSQQEQPGEAAECHDDRQEEATAVHCGCCLRQHR